MMKFWKSRWLTAVVYLACLTPLAVITWKWVHHDLGFNALEYVARYTGRWTLRFLLVTLAITPLRKIPGLGPLMRFRRALGLFTFMYGALHGFHYFVIDAQLNLAVIREDLTIRRFFIAGALALTLMVPLAATSFDRAIRWMGGRNWQRLHRLIYISAMAAVIHFVWQRKVLTDSPLIYAVILGVLLGLRMLFAIQKRLKRRAVVRIPSRAAAPMSRS